VGLVSLLDEMGRAKCKEKDAVIGGAALCAWIFNWPAAVQFAWVGWVALGCSAEIPLDASRKDVFGRLGRM
jgi:hypothetical protein